MSYNEKKDAPFAYESSVHSANVLLRLNLHREHGLLCDVTVIVENQRFQAHRTVLAASSDYFLSRVVQAYDGDFTITLPEEVTVKGFLPLLQFAYTSKLYVTRDNFSEIRKCAKLLEIHDVEETCFEFLNLKFQDNKAKPADYPRKKCCKSFCPKAAGQQSESGRVQVHEVEELWRGEFTQNLKCPAEIENISPSPESPKQPCESLCLDRDSASGFSLCPKYRKFQKACKNGRVRSVSTCSSNQDAQSLSPATSVDASEPVSQPKPQVEDIHATKPDVEVNTVPSQGPGNTYQNLTCVDNKVVMTAAYPPCFPLGPQDFSSVPFSAYQPYRSLINYSDTPNDSSTAGLPEGSNSRQSNLQAAESPTSELVAETPLCAAGSLPLIRERSNVEREVAEHLAKGFWPDVYPAEFPCKQELEMLTSKEPQLENNNMEKRTECPWLGISISNEVQERTFTTLNPVSCPFISNLTNDACANSPQLSSEDGASSKTQETCPYSCPINLDEDSDSDSEEDSVESLSAKEQECEKTLPFNAQKIISLSRYDFQSLVKTHTLTSDQLDCIHDIRRRSKNRIAAQRCRKRKMDCIQNLESEIMKLENEKEHLLKERDQILSTLGETKKNLTGLCQKVCHEAALSREQIHILAKYSSSECPLSFLVPEKGKMFLQCEAILQEFAGGLLDTGEASRRQADEGNSVLHNAAHMTARPHVTVSPRQSGTTGAIADFCQQMSAKCTTDEQN
ncbi:PREDICTED: transcription regulator protein BACH1 [Nanorana parkeri]|uniref:transcription regulator protein BACH1 n=1 Tax=Nanorana parkeri TaxID=125878 RepID=UPI0008542FD5|nr:PREDICTED: transcription regulator protein BACH1 [Nanorana parkeri]